MSKPEDSALNLDLEFLPAWAQQPANKSLYSTYEGEERRDDRRERRDRGPRREGDRRGPGGPGGFGGRGPQQRGGGPGGPRRQEGGPRGPRPQGGRGGPGPRGDQRRGAPAPRPEPTPLPDVELQFRPEETGVDSLARQIKMTGRAYPLFAVAQLILAKPERHTVLFSQKKNAEGKPAQPLFLCALDDTLWLSEDEAVGYVLSKHFATFYQPERTATEPPKGVYTFVAQCGMSGAILGPPNYHDYQNQLRKLHSERFSRMPFDMFKSRVKIVKDEETVKKWIEEQSWKTEYVCLNVPEPLKLPNREEVEKHFRQTHLSNIIKQVESHEVGGAASRSMPCRELQRMVRVKWEEQNRFPLQIATTLSQQFASRGLQFFKVNRTVTHVAVARPHYLDIESNPVSENVKRIVDFVNSHPKCTRRQLFEALAPSAVPMVQPPVEGAPAVELSPDASAVITDLHWLIHQGHVIEFANGIMETAKKPVPKPQKAPAQPAASAEAAAASEATAPEGAALATEGAPAETIAEEASADAAAVETPASPETSVQPESPQEGEQKPPEQQIAS